MKTSFVILVISALFLVVGCRHRDRLPEAASTPRDLASFDRAIDSLKALAASRPTDSEILGQLGMMHYQKAKWMYEMMKYRVDFQMKRIRGTIEGVADEAMKVFDQVARVKPDRAEAYKDEAMVLVLKNEWEQDEEQYMRNSREGLRLLQIADWLRSESSEIWYWKGVSYGRYLRRLGEQEATQSFERALQLDSTNAKAAVALLDPGEWIGAGMSAGRVLELYACVARVETNDVEVMRAKEDDYTWMVWHALEGYETSLRSLPVFMKPMVWLGVRIFMKTSKAAEIREKIVRDGLATADDYCVVMMSSSDVRRALESFGKLLRVSNYAVETGSYGDEFFYRISYKEAVKLQPSNASMYYFYQAVGSWAGRAQESRSLLLKAIEFDPNLTLAYYLVGVSYFEEKDYDNAIVWLKLAIDRKPTDEFAALSAHQLLSLIYLNEGEVKKAVEECKSAMKIDSSFAVLNYQGKIYGRGGGIPFLPDKPIGSDVILERDDRRIASMLNAFGSGGHDLRPQGPFNYYYIQYLAENIFNKKPEEFLKNAIELDPDNEEAHLRLATYYGLSVRHNWVVDEKAKEARDFPVPLWEEAIRTLQSFLKRHPESRKAHMELGQFFIKNHLFARATEEFKRAARLGSPLALDELERMGGQQQ